MTLTVLLAVFASQDKVSFTRQVRPILQAHCYGCHQPAKDKGEYVMTDRARLLKGGDSGEAAVVPGNPGKSKLAAMIARAADGKAEMPKGAEPLAPAEIELIGKWIAEGAVDDSPAAAGPAYDMEHPPTYTRAPVVCSIDFSPDGSLLAVAGFHEILLFKGDGSERVARLVGLSERVQSVRFSPDGKRLAAAAGRPCVGGEVQVWDVEKKALELSVPVTYDTIYGVSWSPDGTKIAFGCADHAVRAVDSKTGAIVLYNAAHTDWALDTVWSKDGAHLVAVDREGAVKLIETATQRFVDNITSITPGGLRGGIAAVARHPERDEVVIGGSDGQPRVYRMQRIVGRVIGDDSNLVRILPAMTGRVWSTAVSRDGKRIAAGSGLDGTGQVAVFSYEFDTKLPDDIRGIMGKVSTTRSAEEKKKLAAYHSADVKLIWSAPVATGIVYSVAFRPDGAVLATAGGDGTVRFHDMETGAVTKEFPAAPVDAAKARGAVAAAARIDAGLQKESLPPRAPVSGLEVLPAAIDLSGPFEYVQLVATGRLTNGEVFDATPMLEVKINGGNVAVGKGGLVEPRKEGRGELKVSLAGYGATIPVTVAGLSAEPKLDFVRDVNPVLSRVGCNAGTCHGAAKGKNGFKLSLRGYDALLDVRSLTDDLASRRAVIASPENSLMLLKPTGAAPHEGGAVLKPDEPYAAILRTWIGQGARVDAASKRPTRIELSPADPVIERIGGRQQMRVVATFADGKTRDVTRESYIESSNTEVATTDRLGRVTSVRRGEAAVLARYEGAYASTPVTVMGDRKGFVWAEPAAYNKIDELVSAKWKRVKILPSDVCTDAEFIRRLMLDLTGLPPSADEVRAFMADGTEPRAKREALLEKLIGSDPFVEHWTNKWADLLQVNGKFLGGEGAAAFRAWIRAEVAGNTAYDAFVRKVLTADGSNKDNPAASYYKILRDPESIVENTTHLFLATRFNCTKCHDHPFERWTQDQYYQTAAYFARVGLKDDGANSGNRRIGGTSVEESRAFYEIVYERDSGEVMHQRTGAETAPKFPFDCAYEAPEGASRRVQLAAWITSRENPYFARSYVNRLWGYLFGVGVIDPIDDIRAGNQPSNPELLEHLTREFIDSGFNTRHVLKLICSSRVYQLSVKTNEWNRDDVLNFSHARARRLPAEVIYDAVYAVTGSTAKIPGVAAGTRAAQLPDAGIDLPGGFLGTLGRPARQSACECERTSELRLGAVMSLITGGTIAEAIADPANALPKLTQQIAEDPKLVEEIFLRVLNRPAQPKEIEAFAAVLGSITADHERLTADLATREEEWKVLQPKLEQEREAAIAKAKAELEAYEKEIAPKVAEAEKARLALIAQRKAELKQHDDGLAAKLPELEKKLASDVAWVPLLAESAVSSNGAVLERRPDYSLVATGKTGKTVYTITTPTDLRGITAVRLELLADASLPGGGPGRAENGNVVLTEFLVSASPKADPKKVVKVELQNAKADFSQEKFAVGQAVDGKPGNEKGWALSPNLGVTHWATFETKEDVGFEGGTILFFALHQKFDEKHQIGRFRISVAVNRRPVGLSLPDELRVLFSTPADQRTKEQQAALLAYVRGTDGERSKKVAALAEAQEPVPIDPGVTVRKETIALVSKPVALDVKLAQLRKDSEQSTQQMKNLRLTAAQDLVWALVNSPAFLFNR